MHTVEANKGAAGIDGVSTEHLREYVHAALDNDSPTIVGGELYSGTGPQGRILKPDGGGVRLLGIPTVMDPMIQQAILQVLTLVFDPEFSPNSFGFRPGKRGHDAVRQAQRYIQEGYRFVVDIDLAQYFDRINHDILMSRVARNVKDKRVLKLIRHYLKSGVMLGGVVITTEEGAQQGGPLSLLLGNILLDDLDKELEKRGCAFVATRTTVTST